MTDAEVTHRVEQAMLGAMMYRPHSAAQLGVSADHFIDSRHQAIAAALTGTAGREQGLLGRLMTFFARRSRATREAAAYAESLPGLCPDPGHIATYFRMLNADRDQRAATARAEAQAQGSQTLAVAADRLGEMRGRTDTSTGMPLDVARLARALSGRLGQQEPAPAPVPGQRAVVPQGQVPQQQGAQAQAPVQPAFAPARTLPQGQPRGESPDTAPDQAAATGPAPGPTGGPARGPGLQPGRIARPEDLEDAILAGLMHNPEEAREVLGWLPPQVFTGPRRELYVLIGQYARARRDIDPVTLAWGVAQEGEALIRPEDILAIGGQGAAPGAASILGKALFADREVTTQLGPDWHRVPHPATAPGAHAASARQPEQAPERQPAPGEPENKRTPQPGHATPTTKNPDQANPAQNPSQRQVRPANGSRPAAQPATEPVPARAVPANLIQQPPPGPGQSGPSQNR